jgi:Domain of unknown function (DUF3337)
VPAKNGEEQLLRSSDTYGRSSTSISSEKPRSSNAEDMYEILCNDIVLPLDMTLAAVRQFVWRQSSELTMHYRRKAPSPFGQTNQTQTLSQTDVRGSAVNGEET